MKRLLALLLTGGLLLVGFVIVGNGAMAATIAPTTTCSNHVDDTPGLGLICRVTVVNRITVTGGSARVTVTECHGAAGDPRASCVTTTNVLTHPVTAVTQCNHSINGAGGTLRCSVGVTNRFFGITPHTSAATVNQCVGSGGGITVGCDPFPATTTNATITQCNGSANGGTLVGLQCTATGTRSSDGLVKINQCNNSANGGGSLVICSANITNRRVADSVTPPPTPRPTPRATRAPPTSAPPTARPNGAPPPTSRPAGAPPPTDTPALTTAPGPDPAPVVFVGVFLLAFLGAVALYSVKRRRAR